MLDNSYVYKKEVDWSLLREGLSIPLGIQVAFQNNIRRFIRRGESKEIFWVLDGITYTVLLKNQAFDAQKYPTHIDILQIRYGCNSPIAEKLRTIFASSYKYICEERLNQAEKPKKRVKIPENQKEYLAIYTTEYDDTYLLECITCGESADAMGIFAKQDEQSYEASINYPDFDPSASIETVRRLAKIRKLNRAIGENLKLLYGYRCQICGDNFGQKFDAHIVESHHIIPFVTSMNNDADNQIIICPNHHRLIHKAEPIFQRNNLLFIYSNGATEKLLLNAHLTVSSATVL